MTVDLAQMLACSLILSRIDYCNAVLHSAPSGTIQKLQWVQNNAASHTAGAAAISHQLAAAGAALATSGAAHHLQTGHPDLQDTSDVSAGISQSTVDTSRHEVARGHCDCLLCHCCMSHSDKLLLANALSALQHHLSGTLSLSLFRTVTRSHYLNLDLKHNCSPPSMLLNCPVRQHLWSHGNTALYKFCIIIIIIMIMLQSRLYGKTNQQ